MLDDPNPHLLPDEKGFEEGAGTPNPGYINSVVGRMRLWLQCMNGLKSLLPGRLLAGLQPPQPDEQPPVHIRVLELCILFWCNPRNGTGLACECKEQTRVA